MLLLGVVVIKNKSYFMHTILFYLPNEWQKCQY